ncbi:MAG: sigma-70 family RNA polymerase sigma factor [Planctomycetaceae bacterium]
MNAGLSNSVGSTSSSLLERVRSQDGRAWRQLTELYGPLIYSWCRQSGLSPPDAADVFQDVCAALFESIAGFRKDGQGGRFRGWLWTVTRSKIIDHFRKQRGKASAQGGSAARDWFAQLPENPPDESAGGAGHSVDSALLRRALQIVRAEFEHRTWEAFWRCAVEGEPTAQIAVDLGISANGVRQAKSRVLRRLREELGELADDLPL